MSESEDFLILGDMRGEPRCPRCKQFEPHKISFVMWRTGRTHLGAEPAFNLQGAGLSRFQM